MAGWQYTSLLVVFLVGAGVSVGVAGYALRYVRDHGPGALVVSVGLLAAHNAVWNVAATLKVASTTLDAKLLFYKLEFFGSAVNPSVALALALAFVGYDRWLTRRTVAALAAVPAVVVALAVVNPGEVMIADPYLVMVDGLVAFEHAFPPLFSAYLAWTLGAVLLSIVVIVAGAYAGRVDWKPAALIAASLAVPLVVASLKVAGVYPPGGDGINVVPAVNTLSITLVAAAVAGYRLFELVPVGRDRAVAVMQDGYLLTDADGVVVDANPAAATLLAGSPDASLRQRSVVDVVPALDGWFDRDAPDETHTGDRDALVQADRVDGEEPVTNDGGTATDDGGAPTADGRQTLTVADRTVEASHSRLRDGGRTVGHVLVLRDVTDRRRYEDRLEEQSTQLELLNRLLRHDINNDMTVVRGMIETAVREIDDPEAAERLETALSASAEVTELTRAARDLMRTMLEDTGELSPVALAPVLRQELADIRDAREGATIRVEGNLPDVRVIADDFLASTFRNLLRNAVQHNDKDTPEVTVSATVEGDSVRVTVTDNGPGISPGQREQIFGKHSKGLASTGTGIGLYLVDSLVDNYGGTVAVDDREDDEGTVFTVTLRRAPDIAPFEDIE